MKKISPSTHRVVNIAHIQPLFLCCKIIPLIVLDVFVAAKERVMHKAIKATRNIGKEEESSFNKKLFH